MCFSWKIGGLQFASDYEKYVACGYRLSSGQPINPCGLWFSYTREHSEQTKQRLGVVSCISIGLYSSGFEPYNIYRLIFRLTG